MSLYMKLSIITPTYNRANLIKNLYNSILNNIESNTEIQQNMKIQWLIMDDGSTDNTSEIIEELIKINKFQIQYYKQQNAGKMSAINNVIQYAEGEMIVECDSDDVFTENAFFNILQAYNEVINRKDLYGICYLKYDLDGNNIGNLFSKNETTMFDLYFKQRRNRRKGNCIFYRN